MRLASFGPVNQLLIAHQHSSPTWLQGAKQRERAGRTVGQEAKPIEILAPFRPGRPWPFQVVKVFDVTDTDGPLLPTISTKGDATLLPAVEAAASRLGLRIEARSDLGQEGRALVLGRATGGVVQVLDRLTATSKLRGLVHEYAHELLHLAPKQRSNTGGLLGSEVVREAEADAAAFLVLGMNGIEADCPSYIAWREGTGAMILRSLERILAAAKAIQTAIEGHRPRGSIPRMTRALARGGQE